MRSLQALTGALTVATMLLTGAGSAAAAWPEQPTTIKIVVASSPGGTTDIAARTIAPYLEKYLGKNATVIVINKPGAGGEVGFVEVAHSKPDGTTIGLAAMPNLLTRIIEKNPPNYTMDDLSFLGHLDTTPGAIVVPPNSQFKTLKELMDYAKANPGTATVAVGGIGADNHLVMLEFMRQSHVEFNVIPFGGSDTARNAVMGGHVTAGSISSGESKSYADLMRTLAVTAEKRVPSLAHLPTAKEQGYDVVGGSSRGFIAPSGLPDDVKSSLIAGIEKAITDPAYGAEMEKRDVQIDFKNAADYDAWIHEQFKQLTELYKAYPWVQ